MIKKIIKNRRQIAEGVTMVSMLYVMIAIHNVRLMYNAKNNRAYGNY